MEFQLELNKKIGSWFTKQFFNHAKKILNASVFRKVIKRKKVAFYFQAIMKTRLKFQEQFMI